MPFHLVLEFTPTGDQPEAIRQLVEGVQAGDRFQTLLGVTGSGKTFTVANTTPSWDRPAPILSHNKTLAAQLYGEFKHFFPKDRVEYFVSYYDYYQPEAYLPVTNTYIEKDLRTTTRSRSSGSVATSALLSGRRNVIVVASVSCIYGIGNPAEFHKSVVHRSKGLKVSRNKLLLDLVEALYSRKDDAPGARPVPGARRWWRSTAYADEAVRIHFRDDEIERLERFDPADRNAVETLDSIAIYPANIFVTSRDTTAQALDDIKADGEAGRLLPRDRQAPGGQAPGGTHALRPGR